MQINLIFLSLFVFMLPLLSVAEEDNTGVKTNNISLPSGPGSLEGLGKAFEPSLNTGGASYSVSIAVPAGIAGHQPEINLSYSSGFGQGIAGLGWQLSIPHVERGLENGQPLYGDDDALMFNGETLVPLTDATYAPALHSAFMRFSREKNRLTAIDKSGNTYAFGQLLAATDDLETLTVNKALANTGPDVREFNGTYQWHLKKVTDAKGQSTEYFYQRLDGSDGKLLPFRIEYGHGTSAASKNAVEFIYESRPDKTSSYQAGFKQQMAHRLSQVIVYHGHRVLWTYELSYALEPGDSLYAEKDAQALDSGLSLLRKVTRWDAARNISLPPIRFEYTHIYGADADVTPLGNFPSDEDIDLNGNGAIDASALSLIEGLPTGINVMGKQAMFTDLTNDGLADWLFWRNGEYFVAKNRSYENGYGGKVQFAEAIKIEQAPVAPMDDSSVHLIDLDGDGQSDFLHRLSDSRWLYYRNQGDASFASPIAYPAPPSIRPGQPGVEFVDINGDQRIDIISSSGRYWRYCLNGPTALEAGYRRSSYDIDYPPYNNFPAAEDIDVNGNAKRDAPAWQCSGSINTSLPADINLVNSQVKLADINGDRIKDVVWLRSLNGKIQINYWLHKGKLAFAPMASIQQGSPSATGLQLDKLRLSDINGDGMADIVYIQPGQVRFWLQQFDHQNGHQWSSEKQISAVNYDRNATAIFDGDLNGNGSSDFSWVSTSHTNSPQYLDISGDTKANLLRVIDNGMGLRTQLDFASMGALQAKAEKSGMAWTTSSPIAQQVVRSRTYIMPLDTTGSGNNDRITQTYTYRDAYYDAYKKQFRGFAFARVETLGDSAKGTQVNRHFFHTGAPDGQDNDGDGLVDERELDGSTEELPLKGQTLSVEQTAKHIDLQDNQHAASSQLVQSQRNVLRIRRIHNIDTPVASITGKEVSFVETRQQQTTYHEFSNTPKTRIKEHQYDDWGNITQTIDYGLLDANDDNQTSVFTFAVHANGIFRLPATTTVTDAYDDLLSATRTFYDDLDIGQIGRGLATKQQQWKQGDNWVTTQESQYDNYGNPILLMDGDGRRRQLVWDSQWHTFPVEEWIFANGLSNEPLRVKAEYDTGLGTLLMHKGFNGEQTRLAYDVFGRLLSIQKPYESSPSIQYSYHFVDPFRHSEYRFSAASSEQRSNATDKTSFVYTRIKRDDGRSEEVKQHIDGLGRELATYSKDEQGYIVSNSQWFDNQGRAVKTFRPWRAYTSTYVLPTNDLISTEQSLDAHGRPLLETLPADKLGRRAIVQYQYAPRQLTITDPDHYQTIQQLDAEDNILLISQQQEIEGQLTWQNTRFKYDALGQLLEIHDAHGNLKEQRFNGLGHKVWQSDLDQGISHYNYDNAGNLKDKTDALGRKLYYRYDGAARLKEVLDNQYQPLFAYHYDAPQIATGLNGYKGKLAWVEEFDTDDSSQTNREHYHYDLRGNLIHKTREVDNLPYQFHYQYDAQDRLTRQVWPDGDNIDYGYNLQGQINSIGELIDAVDYHEDGQLETIHYANGTQQHRSYDDKGQLDNITSLGAETLMMLNNQYDLRGNLTRIDDILDSKNTQTFLYDARSQLKTATGIYGQLRYGYDAIGNMTHKRWSHSDGGTEHNLGRMDYGGTALTKNRQSKGAQPGPHAITSNSVNDASDGSADTRWNYNGIGQRINDSKGNVYHWDQLGRLQQWQKKTAAEDATLTAQEDYRYDFKGRRLSKTTRKPILPGGGLSVASEVLYLDKSYEIRDETTQKHIFLGNLRIARLETAKSEAFKQIRHYSLYAGWNAIYLAINPEGSSLVQQLGHLASRADEILHFYAPTQTYQQYLASGASSLNKLQAGQVYWLNINNTADAYPFQWQVEGTASNDKPGHVRVLQAGWNQTTLPVSADTDIKQFTQATAIERIWYYQQAQDRWYRWSKQDDHSAALNNLTQLQPDAIYWVYSPRDQVISSASGINSQKFFLHNNHLGSVAISLDEAGTVKAESQYLPYGAIAPASVEAQPHLQTLQPYGFSAKELDGSGLMYFEARYYDPVSTRFVSPDPLFVNNLDKCVDSVIECNAYQYTGNNPVVRIDLDGLASGDIRSYENATQNMSPGQVSEFNAQQNQNFSDTLSAVGTAAETIDNAHTVAGLASGVGAVSVAAKVGLKGLIKGAVSAVKSFFSQDKGEVFYRTMSKTDYQTLKKTGDLPATSETFISPTKAFSSNYDGVMTKITLKPGTVKKLEDVGVRDQSKVTKAAYPEMPVVEGGWGDTNAYFKKEGTQINIGLGKGKALKIFNKNINKVNKVR